MSTDKIYSSTDVDTDKVLSQTFKLTGLALVFSTLVGYISNLMGLTSILSGSWVTIGLFVISLCVMFYVFKNSEGAKGIIGVFLFAGIFGLLLSPIVNFYLSSNPGAVISALATTGIVTLLASLTGSSKKANYSGLGRYLFFGLIALIVSSVINIFISNSLFDLMLSVIGSIIFTLYIIYDVNNIVRGKENNYVRAALSMYLNIVNLFINLLGLFGRD